MLTDFFRDILFGNLVVPSLTISSTFVHGESLSSALLHGIPNLTTLSASQSEPLGAVEVELLRVEHPKVTVFNACEARVLVMK